MNIKTTHIQLLLLFGAILAALIGYSSVEQGDHITTILMILLLVSFLSVANWLEGKQQLNKDNNQ